MKASVVLLPFLAAMAVAQTEPENGNPPVEAPAQPEQQPPANAVPDAAAPVLNAPGNTPDQADEDVDREVDAPPAEDDLEEEPSGDEQALPVVGTPGNTPDAADKDGEQSEDKDEDKAEDKDDEQSEDKDEDSADEPSNNQGDSDKSEEDNEDGDSGGSNNGNGNGSRRDGFGIRMQCFRMTRLEKLAKLGEDEEGLKRLTDNDEEQIERLKEKSVKAAKDLEELQSDKELVETCEKIFTQVKRDQQCFEMSRLQSLAKLVSDEEALAQRTNGNEERAERLKSKVAEGEARLKELESDKELVEYCNDKEVRIKCREIEHIEKFLLRASDKDFLEQRFGDSEEGREIFENRTARLQGKLKALTEEDGLLETCAKITENPDFGKSALEATQDSTDDVEGGAVPGSMPSTATMFSIAALLIASVLIL